MLSIIELHFEYQPGLVGHETWLSVTPNDEYLMIFDDMLHHVHEVISLFT